MLKLIPGILTIGLLATGCSRSTGSELSAAAAPQHQKMATPTSEPGSRPVAGTAPRPTAAHARRRDDERMALRTEPIVQEAEATKGEDATKIAIGAGAGAVIGAVVGGKSGAAKGAVIGGAAGTGVVVATRGKEVRLDPGTDIPVKLAAPLSIRVRVQLPPSGYIAAICSVPGMARTLPPPPRP